MGWNDKLKNKNDEDVGSAKEHVGMAVGDADTEHEAQADQTRSNLEQGTENVKDAFKKE